MSLEDVSQILEEAKTRWLRPSEVCGIIRNYHRFHLKPDPPYKPSGGSLFLFDRKTLRYFRKDGHRWRKKKDGKSVREAHEKLKSGSVDVLHCYYAHGEDNENFQRRSYWMLEGQLEHIVLVHYREVNEGGKLESSDFVSSDAGFRNLCGGDLPTIIAPSSYGSSHAKVAWSEQAPSSEIDDVDSGKEFSGSPLVEASRGSGLQICHVREDATFSKSESFCDSDSLAYRWSPVDLGRWNFNSPDDIFPINVAEIEGRVTDVGSSPEFGPAVLDACTSSELPGVCWGADVGDHGSNKDFMTVPETLSFEFSDQHEKTFEICKTNENSANEEFHPLEIEASEDEYIPGNVSGPQPGGLKRLDSFCRWMSEEMGEVCDVPYIAEDSSDCWNAMDTSNDEKELSISSRELQLDFGSLGPSVSQDQSFNILDFSPDWAYAGCETKVLIYGNFLGEAHRANLRWSCMFGQVEVPAEALATHALRCRAPPLPPGRVPFYVSRSNRLACSQIREFEYRDKGNEGASSPPSCAGEEKEEEEINLRMRLARLLSAGSEGIGVCLQRWFNANDAGEDDKGRNALDEGGLGVIHLTAALGYEWAMKPIVAAGVNPSFRDRRGWTALHWAAYFGREETAATLVALGTSPGAVADPTVEYPQGRTAADVASSRGHKGIAGYLAEADLTGQLSRLDLEEPAAAPEEASLAAVRRAAQAAARVQSALRAADPGCGSGVARKSPSSAAARIQRKYRGWRGRREFLRVRERVVRIQAHVRGHQARRQYRRWVWSVGIVEKAILRWRRRGRGLRGFRAMDGEPAAEEEEDAYEFLRRGREEKAAAAERALARVLSMARHPESRRQYASMLLSSSSARAAAHHGGRQQQA
ncbi:calmodulin-binding transcription activator 2-like isoform X2 [Wolffia australiana]